MQKPGSQGTGFPIESPCRSASGYIETPWKNISMSDRNRYPPAIKQQQQTAINTRTITIIIAILVVLPSDS
jgi:hypothetical protein